MAECWPAGPRMPFIAPNWHTIAESNVSFHCPYNCFDIRSDLEFGGFGDSSPVSAQVVGKSNECSLFSSRRPTLPLFVNSRRIKSRNQSKSCLLYCDRERLLLSAINHSIIAYNLNEIDGEEQHKRNELRLIEANASDESDTTRHCFTFDRSLTGSAFAFNARHVYSAHSFGPHFEPIIELKLNIYRNDSSEVTALSNSIIKMFKFDENERLSQFYEMNEENESQTEFGFCDRNPFMRNELLISQPKGNRFGSYDIETNALIWSPKRGPFRGHLHKQIGLNWSRLHSRMFFYGESDRLMLVDVRGVKDVVNLSAIGSDNFYSWERYSTICPNLCDGHQLYVSSDYHLFIVDTRYPKQSLNQVNHMLTNSVIKNMKNTIFESNDKSNTELLLLSNDENTSLMSYENGINIQPKSLHSPLHLSVPTDIDIKFEDYNLIGTQLITFTKQIGFSIALLTNFGDIFMQDYYPSSDNTEKCWRRGVEFSNLSFDDLTNSYMNHINRYLSELSCEHNIDENGCDEADGIDRCIDCDLLESSCKRDRNVCVCLNNYAESAEDYKTIEETSHDIEEYSYTLLNSDVKLDNLDVIETSQFNNITANILKCWINEEQD